MLGTSVHLGVRHGDDRFYDAAKARRRSVAGGLAALPPAEPSAGPSNLDRFLESVTPSVPAQYPSKMRMRGWRTCDVEYPPFFNLGDLWESFKEWSAYGAGVPLVLNGCDGVIQYYVPYLSGIQLYGDARRQHVSSRRAGEYSDGDSCQDSCSDGSSDYETETRLRSSQEGISSDYNGFESSRGCLLFEYLELEIPYCREPLADKISSLAGGFPDLKNLRSCDLLPSSWFSVAWYPIYRIPTGPTFKKLDACFLTFHYLSMPLRGDGAAAPVIAYPQGSDGAPMMSLPVFGLASYKFRNSMWLSSGHERQLASNLQQAADRWLQHVRVNHPDYQFFISQGGHHR